MHFISKKKASQLALNIFCTPRGGKLKPHQIKYLDTLNSQVLTLNDMSIQTYYIDNNSSNTVLMSHGWESNAARWKRMINYFEDIQVNIALLDGPAHGRSDSKYFNAVLYADMINIVSNYYKPNFIIGHSIGGFASALYLYKYKPSFIKDFVILASPNTMDSILTEYQRIMRMNKQLMDSLNQLIELKFNQPVSHYKVSNFIKKLPVRGIIIHDENDDINKFEEAIEIKEAWGENCTLITANGKGHGLQDKIVYANVKEYITNNINKITA
jgi:predicted alpha/beta hydrolase family esterase